MFRPAPTEAEPKNLQITYVVRVDPAGWIPTWVTNLVAADQAPASDSHVRSVDALNAAIAERGWVKTSNRAGAG